MIEMSNNMRKVNEYYLGKNQAVAVIEDKESLCPALNDSDIVFFFNQLTLDFDDIQNETVNQITKNGYFLFQFNQLERIEKMKMKGVVND